MFSVGNDSNGNLLSEQTSSCCHSPIVNQSISAGDINGDGLLDLAVPAGGRIELFFNKNKLDALLGDINCDFEVNLLDIQPFVEVLTMGNYAVKADINVDGVVDLLDIAPFIALLTP